MDNIAPRLDTFTLPAGVRLPVVAADQPQYLPLPAIATADGKIVSQWLPNADDLERLNAAEAITLVSWTFGDPLQPLWMGVGGLDLATRDTPVNAIARMDARAKKLAHKLAELVALTPVQEETIGRALVYFAFHP